MENTLSSLPVVLGGGSEMSIAVSMETYDDECGCWATEVPCDFCGGWIRDIRGSPQTPPPDICPDCVENRVGEVEELIAHWHDAVVEPVILQGHSYPLARLTDVLAYEARQGRTVSIAIQHAGGWAVTSESPACTCKIYIGDDKDCPVHGQRMEAI